MVGIADSVDDFPNADTLGRIVYTILLGTCGCLGLGAGAAVLAGKPWAKVLILGWAATMLAVGIISAFVWPWSGMVPTLATIVGILLLTSLTYRAWKATARSQAQ